MRHFSCSMLCLVAILIGIPIHCIGQQQPQKTTEQTAVLALPWRAVGIWSAMPGILMVLNDGKPHLFVVDTGAVESQIDTVVAKRQNLPVKSVAPGKSTKQYIECPINLGPDVYAYPNMPLVLMNMQALQQETPNRYS